MVAGASERVAGLDDQKVRIAVAVRRHMTAAMHQRDYRIQNLVVVGPTGGGKTFLLRHLLASAGCPFIELNMTSYSEVGYAGMDLNAFPVSFYSAPWLVTGEKRRDLTPLVERWGVVVLDEFDKVAFRKDPAGRDTGRAMQSELLRIAEGDIVYARARDSDMGTAFSTHHILFVAVGAFEGLSRVVDPSTQDSYVRAEPYHIQRFGFLEELVGRFSTIVALPPLKEDHMYRIICEHIWPNWLQMATDDGFDLCASDEALKLIANQACQRGIGARGLEPLIEKALWKAWGTVRPGQVIWLGPEHVATGAVVRDPVAA